MTQAAPRPGRQGWALRRLLDIHGHYTTEDRALFPMLLRQGRGDGALAGVIDRLQADHRRLTGQLEEVERALAALPGDAAARAAAAGAIARLSDRLETHLRVEEERLAPALNALSRVLPEDQLGGR